MEARQGTDVQCLGFWLTQTGSLAYLSLVKGAHILWSAVVGVHFFASALASLNESQRVDWVRHERY